MLNGSQQDGKKHFSLCVGDFCKAYITFRALVYKSAINNGTPLGIIWSVASCIICEDIKEVLLILSYFKLLGLLHNEHIIKYTMKTVHISLF